MAKSTVSVPMRTRPAVAPPKGVTAKTPTIVINTTTQPRSPRRWAIRHTDRIEIGGGALFPQIKSSRKDIVLAVVAMGLAASLVYAAKNGFELLKEHISKKSEAKATVPEPPKIQTIVDCVNSAGEPKKVLIPDMVQKGGISIFAGREGAGKSLLGHQAAIELARGYGDFVAEDISPQNVIIIDGEMDEDDYVSRFGNMEIPSNITRISETDFANLKQLAEYIKGIVSGLLSPATIIIDNLMALSLENLTGKAVNEFFRDLKKIPRGSEPTITFVVVDPLGKTPEGHPLDNSLLAGSANIARFAHNIIILDYSARGNTYRYIKFTKQRKAALPDEVLEVVISEEEYLHFEVIGNSREADVVRNKTNLRRYGQIPEGVVDDDEEEEAPEEDGRGRLWTDEDTARLIELASTLETPDKETIGLMMERHPNFIYRKAKLYGIQLMSKPRGRKPKQQGPDEQ